MKNSNQNKLTDNINDMSRQDYIDNDICPHCQHDLTTWHELGRDGQICLSCKFVMITN